MSITLDTLFTRWFACMREASNKASSEFAHKEPKLLPEVAAERTMRSMRGRSQ
jgi:hypothetical protein